MIERVSVIIVNWSGLEHLQVCIPAVLAQDYPDFHVIVVDNGSTDGSVAWLRSNYPKLQLICNDTNCGFAKGNNQGFRIMEGAYAALLNTDAWPETGWLAALVDAAQTDERVGMVASQVRLAYSPGLVDSAGIEVDVLGVAWNRNFGAAVEQEPAEVVEVFGPSGSAALYRREMLDEVGLFDERYFAYYEDVELAWRARRAGWRCLYAPSAIVLHRNSAASRQGPVFKAYYLSRNRVWTFVRHYPARRLLIWWPLILLFDAASWMLPLFRGRSGSLRGHIDAIRQWRQMWRERRQHTDWLYDVPLAPLWLRGRWMPRSQQ